MTRKVWLVERVASAKRRSSMWTWEVDFEQGCYLTKAGALNGAAEGNGRSRVSRWELKRVRAPEKKRGKR